MRLAFDPQYPARMEEDYDQDDIGSLDLVLTPVIDSEQGRMATVPEAEISQPGLRRNSEPAVRAPLPLPRPRPEERRHRRRTPPQHGQILGRENPNTSLTPMAWRREGFWNVESDGED
jgi:hypothetical protein